MIDFECIACQRGSLTGNAEQLSSVHHSPAITLTVDITRKQATHWAADAVKVVEADYDVIIGAVRSLNLELVYTSCVLSADLDKLPV